MIVWLVACAGGDSGPGSTPIGVPPPSVSVTVSEVDGLVNARVISLSLAEPAAVQVTCAGADETFAWTSPEQVDHEIELLGLLAAAPYTCALTAEYASGPQSASFDFTTSALPPGFPPVTALGATAPSYVLLNQFWDGIDAVDQRLILYDHLGRVRWYYEIGIDVAGDLDVRLLDDGTVLFGGAYGATPTMLTLTHDVVRVAPPATTGRNYHHHTEITNEGTWLSLVLADNGLGDGVEWTGFAVEEREPSTGLLEWVWNTQQQLDAGLLPTSSEGGDPYHGNWAERSGDEVRVSLRGTNEILSIDRADGSLLWRMGKGGDFALFDASGAPLDDDQWFFTQHAPEPSDDRLLVYDNGTSRPGETASRIADFAVDWEARTAQLLWTWTRPYFKEPIWGDVDRLPDGNVLVTIGHCEDCGWIDDEGRSSVLELDPETGEVVWELLFDDPMVGLYRSERIDACALFANTTMCPVSGP
jgi:hypothetical protein